jgi:hypothetical protein
MPVATPGSDGRLKAFKNKGKDTEVTTFSYLAVFQISTCLQISPFFSKSFLLPHDPFSFDFRARG